MWSGIVSELFNVRLRVGEDAEVHGIISIWLCSLSLVLNIVTGSKCLVSAQAVSSNELSSSDSLYSSGCCSTFSFSDKDHSK